MKEHALFISNKGFYLGGGEHSFFGLVTQVGDHLSRIVLLPDRGDLYDQLCAHGLPIEVISLPAVRFHHAPACIGALKKVVRLIRRENISLLYANGSRAAFYGGIAARISRVPMVWHCRMADRDPKLDWLLCHLSTRIIANSHATANRFKNFGKAEIDVVYNGIDLEWIKKRDDLDALDIPPHWCMVLHCSRISRFKRHDMSIEAFERVANRYPDLHLFMVGGKDESDAAWYDNMQARSVRSPVGNRIHWVGHVNDVRPYLHRAEMLLLPSENEPFGRVIIEAMTSGVPVIAASSGGIPEIITDKFNGLLVTSGDIEALSAAMEKIITRHSLREKLVKNGIKRAETFSIERHVSAIERIINSLH